MKPSELLIVVGAAAFGVGVAAVASAGAASFGPVPVPVACALLAFVIQWVAFVPANAAKTERYYDLTGSVTYLAVVGLALVGGGGGGPRAWLASAMVAVWAVRLGTFLARRIHRAGKDGRFDTIKQSPGAFLVAWTIQGLWVTLTALAVIVMNASPAGSAPLGPLDAVGAALWALGFGVEVVADRQKSAFAADSANAGRWIDSGLWASSRHPNYAGEITLWLGLFVMGASAYAGAQWVAVLSPVFVYVLLTRISGVPLLERRADAKWGDDPAYLAYRARTPVLFPWGPRGGPAAAPPTPAERHPRT